MDKIRKFFVILFGSLSLFFAIVAVHNHFYEKKLLQSSKNFLHWSNDISNSAKKANKLVFAVVDNIKLSPKIRKILDKHFAITVLDRKENYADFEALNYVLKKYTRSKNDVACAIFTPEMKPVYVMSKINERKLEKILPAIKKTYANNPEQFLNRVEANVVSFKNEEKVLSHFYEMFSATGVGAVHSMNFTSILNFFAPKNDVYENEILKLCNSDTDNIPLAILTENARLTFRIYKNHQAITQHLLTKLKKRFVKEKNNLSKLLIARAISEATSTTNQELRVIADALLNENTKKSVAENALTLSILSKAYFVYEKEEYLQKASEIFDTLKSIIEDSQTQILTFRNSEKIYTKENLNAFDFAIIANSVCDYAKVSTDESAIDIAVNAIKNLDSNFAFNHFWTLNSQHSTSANFARITIVDDNNIPSYIGEANQAIIKIKRKLGKENISPVERNIERLARNHTLSRASIKLAYY